jgi:hypothetical protein
METADDALPADASGMVCKLEDGTIHDGMQSANHNDVFHPTVDAEVQLKFDKMTDELKLKSKSYTPNLHGKETPSFGMADFMYSVILAMFTDAKHRNSYSQHWKHQTTMHMSMFAGVVSSRSGPVAPLSYVDPEDSTSEEDGKTNKKHIYSTPENMRRCKITAKEKFDLLFYYTLPGGSMFFSEYQYAKAITETNEYEHDIEPDSDDAIEAYNEAYRSGMEPAVDLMRMHKNAKAALGGGGGDHNKIDLTSIIERIAPDERATTDEQKRVARINVLSLIDRMLIPLIDAICWIATLDSSIDNGASGASVNVAILAISTDVKSWIVDHLHGGTILIDRIAHSFRKMRTLFDWFDDEAAIGPIDKVTISIGNDKTIVVSGNRVDTQPAGSELETAIQYAETDKERKAYASVANYWARLNPDVLEKNINDLSPDEQLNVRNNLVVFDAIEQRASDTEKLVDMFLPEKTEAFASMSSDERRVARRRVKRFNRLKKREAATEFAARVAAQPGNTDQPEYDELGPLFDFAENNEEREAYTDVKKRLGTQLLEIEATLETRKDAAEQWADMGQVARDIAFGAMQVDERRVALRRMKMLELMITRETATNFANQKNLMTFDSIYSHHASSSPLVPAYYADDVYSPDAAWGAMLSLYRTRNPAESGAPLDLCIYGSGAILIHDLALTEPDEWRINYGKVTIVDGVGEAPAAYTMALSDKPEALRKLIGHGDVDIYAQHVDAAGQLIAHTTAFLTQSLNVNAVVKTDPLAGADGALLENDKGDTLDVTHVDVLYGHKTIRGRNVMQRARIMDVVEKEIEPVSKHVFTITQNNKIILKLHVATLARLHSDYKNAGHVFESKATSIIIPKIKPTNEERREKSLSLATFWQNKAKKAAAAIDTIDTLLVYQQTRTPTPSWAAVANSPTPVLSSNTPTRHTRMQLPLRPNDPNKARQKKQNPTQSEFTGLLTVGEWCHQAVMEHIAAGQASAGAVESQEPGAPGELGESSPTDELKNALRDISVRQFARNVTLHSMTTWQQPNTQSLTQTDRYTRLTLVRGPDTASTREHTSVVITEAFECDMSVTLNNSNEEPDAPLDAQPNTVHRVAVPGVALVDGNISTVLLMCDVRRAVTELRFKLGDDIYNLLKWVNEDGRLAVAAGASENLFEKVGTEHTEESQSIARSPLATGADFINDGGVDVTISTLAESDPLSAWSVASSNNGLTDDETVGLILSGTPRYTDDKSLDFLTGMIQKYSNRNYQAEGKIEGWLDTGKGIESLHAFFDRAVANNNTAVVLVLLKNKHIQARVNDMSVDAPKTVHDLFTQAAKAYEAGIVRLLIQNEHIENWARTQVRGGILESYVLWTVDTWSTDDAIREDCQQQIIDALVRDNPHAELMVRGDVFLSGDIYLREQSIEKIPIEFGFVHANGALFLNKNRLSTLPDTFWCVTIGGDLDLSENLLHRLPDTFGRVTIGGNLYLSGNSLKKLPDTFVRVTIGGNLYLNGNQLLYVPESFPHVNGEVIRYGHEQSYIGYYNDPSAVNYAVGSDDDELFWAQAAPTHEPGTSGEDLQLP